MSERTSIESYREAHASGLIGKRQMEVLGFVIAHQPCSQGDVSRHFADASSSYQPRFRELEDAGLIAADGTTTDRVTGREVKVYRATGAVPTRRVQRRRRKVRATLEPAGDGLFRVTFEPAISIEAATTFDFSLAL
jgi:hypothetical protein